MKLKTVKLDNTDKILVYNIGDVHYGNENCDREAFKKVVDEIENNPNAYWLSTGDLLEVSLKDSLGDVYKSLSLNEELNEILEILRPIKHKCFGIVGSNHHYRVEKRIGLNFDALLCKLLEVDYLGLTGYLRIIVGNVGYYLALHHGIGYGKSKGIKANNLVYFGNVAKGFDIYMIGHLHSFMYFVENDLVLDKKHNKVSNIYSHYVITGHFLKYRSSYAERKLLKPTPIGCAVLELKGGQSVAQKNIDVFFKTC